ncbi:unnamed protein product [Clonostachys rosea]|uniref:Major facilitator superfamily (MFS) profile domain-containing protein n=1 Tax=Bionectria ochroleuca TaxID=29856 RepID=A0ABY6U3C1_BIOOC|nr:unnamed protein product [Clonostachys rosea]
MAQSTHPNNPKAPDQEEKVESVHFAHIPIAGQTIEPSRDAEALPLPSDHKSERKLRLKIDLHVVPTVAILWLFCFIDRANIGNARISGLDESLELQGYDYNIILSCFYISYILFEFPATLLCKQVGPGWFIPATTFLFGICTISTAFVQTRAQMCAMRFLLGLFEAGMLPGIAYYLSRWYKRAELAFRLSLYLVMTPLAGAFGGLLASAILKLNGFGNLRDWRMIFAIEGIVTTSLGLIAFATMTDRPETARWLSTEEKEKCRARISSERLLQSEVLDKVDKVKIWRGIANPATLTTAVAFFFSNVTVQGLGVFLPTIIATIYPNTSLVQQQLYSVPPYIVGSAVNLAVPALSWRFDKRQVFMIGATPTIIAGYIIFLASSSPPVLYAACFLIASSAFVMGPMSAAQVSANVVSDTSRNSAIATNVLIGNMGGLLSSWTFLSNQAPRYRSGNGLNLACATMQLLILFSALMWFKRDNRMRQERDMDSELSGWSPEQIEDLDWKHPAFRWKP